MLIRHPVYGRTQPLDTFVGAFRRGVCQRRPGFLELVAVKADLLELGVGELGPLELGVREAGLPSLGALEAGLLELCAVDTGPPGIARR